MLYTPATKTALRICFRAHRDQLDKSNIPYVFHPFHLAEQMETEHEVCVALLHDVMEDTDITADEMIAEGIPAAYIETCKLMTHARGVPYFDYVEQLKHDPVARKVKMADLRHNSDLTRFDHEPTEWDLKRWKKYQKALAMLQEVEARDK